MKRKWMAWLLFLGWLGVIFFFSAQSGPESSSMSNGLLHTLRAFLPIPENILHVFIRKGAHFTEYFILGILSIRLLREYRPVSFKWVWVLCIFCFCYACSDEFHQWFVAGRSPNILDVFIDFSGAFLGIFLLFLKNREKSNT